MDVLSPTSQNAWQEWDAAHAPRERAKCRSHLGAAHIVSESGAPAEARRTVFARQFVGTSHPNLQKQYKVNVFIATWTSCRPRRKMRGRNGTRRAPRAKGRNVALALAPRTVFLTVALRLRRGAQFSLANQFVGRGLLGGRGGAWGLPKPPGASCTRPQMPAQPLRRAEEFPSVTATAGPPAVPNQLADVTSPPSCASTVSYVVGGRVGMGMPCLARSSWLA